MHHIHYDDASVDDDDQSNGGEALKVIKIIH
jgi:hypothetical protein